MSKYTTGEIAKLCGVTVRTVVIVCIAGKLYRKLKVSAQNKSVLY